MRRGDLGQPSSRGQKGLRSSAMGVAVDRGERIGERIRAERQDRGLRIEQLAQASGLTVSFISQVERNITNLSLDSLRRICKALDIPMFKLFLNDQASEELIVRAGKRTRLRFPDRQVEYQLLSPTLQAGLEVMEVILEPGETTAEEPLAHRGEEVVIVIKGRIEVEYGDEKYRLDSGDSIYLVSSVPHKFKNVSRGQSRLIMSILNQFPRMNPESVRVYVKSGSQAS